MRGAIKINGNSDSYQTDASADPATKADAFTAAGTGNRSALISVIVLALICLTTVAAYSPILFNFFVGDDFVHLVWLKDAVHNHEMIWRNFHSSWLDGTTTKFYRPLISIFMVSDYLLNGINGFGYHITNLLFHLISALLLFFIIKDLTANSQAERVNNGSEWALVSAAIFALYPLHPEAVSWITGRVDTIVTTFCLAAFVAYIRWRKSYRLSWLGLSIVSFILALLSKEMAITIPPMLIAYEILLGPNTENGSTAAGLFKPLLGRALHTLPYFLVLAGYFVLRWYSLGTFVGGYDDSLFFIADIKSFILSWLHALRMMIVPLNRDLLGSHHLLTKAWETLTITAIVLGLVKLLKNKIYWRQLLFSFGWLILCLAPVYKIFAISDDLQGSRLAYLATVPLSVLFAYGLTSFNCAGSPIMRILKNAPAILLTTVCTATLWINNQPWKMAGEESNAIRAGLQEIYTRTAGDPQTLLLGLPDQIHGAYVCRNAVTGMTTRPQLSRDIGNCLLVNQFEPILPFGFLKSSLAKASDAVHIYRWSPSAKTFIPVTLNSGANNAPANNQTADRTKNIDEKTFQGQRLKKMLQPLDDGSTTLTFDADGTAQLQPTTPNKRAAVIIDMSAQRCWTTEFIAATVKVTEPGKAGVGADLLYSNNISPEFQLARRTHSETSANKGLQVWLFPLRSLPEWSFGAGPARLKLMLPTGCSMQLQTLSVMPPNVLLPQLDFKNSGYLGSKGYLHLGPDKPSQELTFDASAIPNATTTEIEITRPNLLFEEQNCKHFSKVAGKRLTGPLRGTISLQWQDYPAAGIYELRLWAKDRNDKIVGLASDHIVLSVLPK